jgi:ABC-type Fe3+-citrate transport system substrate-binding protein
MTFQIYFDKRRDDYHDEIEQFKIIANEFINLKQDKEGQQKVREIIEQIERKEIRRIYGADALRII